ncbi:unnamed protein product [Urochloa humidicola]
MGSGMSSFRRRRGFVFDPMKGVIPLLGLQVALEYGRPESSRPPVTAALLAANVLLFLRPGALDGILPKTSEVAVSYQHSLEFILSKNFLSPFYHSNELHLFGNMTSLLWMGVQLETYMGSAEFASMVAALIGLSQGITGLLSQILSLLGCDIAYYGHQTVGFSGVLFGMKVVLTAWPNRVIWLSGTLIPAKYAVWVELLPVDRCLLLFQRSPTVLDRRRPPSISTTSTRPALPKARGQSFHSMRCHHMGQIQRGGSRG